MVLWQFCSHHTCKLSTPFNHTRMLVLYLGQSDFGNLSLILIKEKLDINLTWFLYKAKLTIKSSFVDLMYANYE